MPADSNQTINVLLVNKPKETPIIDVGLICDEELIVSARTDWKDVVDEIAGGIEEGYPYQAIVIDTDYSNPSGPGDSSHALSRIIGMYEAHGLVPPVFVALSRREDLRQIAAIRGGSQIPIDYLCSTLPDKMAEYAEKLAELIITNVTS